MCLAIEWEKLEDRLRYPFVYHADGTSDLIWTLNLGIILSGEQYRSLATWQITGHCGDPVSLGSEVREGQYLLFSTLENLVLECTAASI